MLEHILQEFNSMFGWYFWKIIHRIIGFYLLNKGENIYKKLYRYGSATSND